MPLNDAIPVSNAAVRVHRRARPLHRPVPAILLLLSAGPALAQSESACPPPRKLAAGACVVACPAGYEDRGRDCVYRSLSR